MSKLFEEVSKFKTNAWQSQQSAVVYHNSTVAAPMIFSTARLTMYLRYVQRYAPPRPKILDLGCGSGIIATELHDLGYDVVACDVSQSMLDKLSQERGERDFELRLGDGYNIPAQTGEFDMVVSRMFIQHFPDWPLILAEKARVTRPGGIVLFDFGNLEHVLACDPNLGRSDDFSYCADPAMPEKFYALATENEMEAQANGCGLEVLEIAPHGLLLANAFLWKALKADGVADLDAKLDQILQHEKARELLLLIEEFCVPHFPKTLTYGNITVLQRSSSETSAGSGEFFTFGRMLLTKAISLLRARFTK